MTDYILVLTHHPDYAGREWSLSGNDYATLTIHDGGPKPTKKALDDRYEQVVTDLAWANIRTERDRLLTASDWTRMDDAPLSDAERQAWADYRQALRDIPQDYATPDDVVWPETP